MTRLLRLYQYEYSSAGMISVKWDIGWHISVSVQKNCNFYVEFSLFEVFEIYYDTSRQLFQQTTLAIGTI